MAKQKYKTVSVIPFKIDTDITLKNIAADPNRMEIRERKREQREELLSGKTVLSFEFESADSHVDVDLFSGNIGIVTITRIHEIESDLSLEDQVRAILPERKRMHTAFIDQTDSSIADLRRLLRSMSSDDESRGQVTANFDLSYAFTLYGFMENAWIRPELLMALSEPSKVGIEDSIFFNEIRDEIEIMTPATDSKWIVENNSDLRSGVIGLISWSGIVVIAKSWDYLNDYTFLEKRLQHAWFSLYRKMEYLYGIIENKSRSMNTTVINTIREEVSLELLHFDEILDPSLPSRHAIILKRMIETSGLDKLKEKVEAQLKFLEIRALKKKEQREGSVQRLITSFLFLIALVTAYPSLSTLVAPIAKGGLSNLFAFIIVALLFSGFEVIIFRRNEKSKN